MTYLAPSSILATVYYEQTAKLAVKNATIGHVAICDDYYALHPRKQGPEKT